MNDYLKRFSLEGKRVMVTGASEGIGAEIASLLAEAGAAVAIVGRDKAGLAQTAAKVTAAARECLTIEADLVMHRSNHAEWKLTLRAADILRLMAKCSGLIATAGKVGSTEETTVAHSQMQARDKAWAPTLPPPTAPPQCIADAICMPAEKSDGSAHSDAAQ